VLEAPESGPFIASIEFLTPFALVVMQSSQHANYSAQQAALDHHRDAEIVAINIEIQFTTAYGAYTVRPVSSRSDSPKGFVPRSPAFWKDFDVRVFAGDTGRADDRDRDDGGGAESGSLPEVTPSEFTGQPTYRCDNDGGCTLNGAILHLELPAAAFESGFATVEVTPPEGTGVSVGFDLSSLR